ncbi:MAG: hypothetical protein COB90_08645 [Hyphomicrobiales bacterium]|nr:MAG: hypothetical protein COB90_08645 [Hyphomicrobiales bacterium]
MTDHDPHPVFDTPQMRKRQIEAMFQSSGKNRLDQKLESWLLSKGQSIASNLLTGALERHTLIEETGNPDREVITDAILTDIRFAFKEATLTMLISRGLMADTLELMGENNSYHPVADYLDGLVWDKKPRLDGWIEQYIGVEDTRLFRSFARKILCAAVRRIRKPGCKFDHALILQGNQGIGKSSLIRALSPDPDWVTDQVKVGDNAREVIENSRGAWLVELAELEGFSSRQASEIKSFMTTTNDRARRAYARFPEDVLRGFVLFGTTNEHNFLRDLTGNRRFWIVPAKYCNYGGLARERDQIWAEAVVREPLELLWLESPGLKEAHEKLNNHLMDYGPWFELLSEIIPNEGDLKIPVRDVWSIVGVSAGNLAGISRRQQSDLRSAMVGLGFYGERFILSHRGSKLRAFLRGEKDKAIWWMLADTQKRDG